MLYLAFGYVCFKKALDRRAGRTVAWVTGGRDAAAFRKLYDKVKCLDKCIFYTDDRDAFTRVLTAERHIIGKEHTISIEQVHGQCFYQTVGGYERT